MSADITTGTEEFNNVYDLLSFIQRTLVVPKGRYNKFGDYSYRACEDICEAVKKLLPEGASLVLYDAIEMIGDRYYVKATAVLTHGDDSLQCTASAREAAAKKGMDESQITGAASSYARKYALNGLFLIDDTKDADAQEPTEADIKAEKVAKAKAWIVTFTENMANTKTLEELEELLAKAQKNLDGIKGNYNEDESGVNLWRGVENAINATKLRFGVSQVME